MRYNLANSDSQVYTTLFCACKFSQADFQNFYL
ncbi:unnamed protein product [Chironomus riparius]|uniref:Uncharacterized protein n=1 Tax=Chironomus riparius TaxID=315576 RepID=A0A9N9RQZ0_9DIPT|nr:unnamed protein product [Chironomus riparius]